MLGASPSSLSYPERIRRLGAFWQHFSLYRRNCDGGSGSIISVFREDCPYPVWKRSTWLERDQFPTAEFNYDLPFFKQLWELFKQCPIPHMTGLNTENCDYCDDWWNSKNCYLCHSGLDCEDCIACYRTLKCKDCRGAVFSFSCELCTEVLQAHQCSNVIYGSHVWQCHDSAFLFDCRNCTDCFMCWNLRNKRHCIKNKQYTPDEYTKLRAQYDLSSHSTFQRIKNEFVALRNTQAFWKALDQERCSDSTGCFIEGLQNCLECYYYSDTVDCVNCTRGAFMKNSLDTIGCWNGELIFNSVLVGDKRSYHVHNSFHVNDSNFLDYCGFCVRCENCFGCCGLIGKKFCILNKQYSESNYHAEVNKIKSLMRLQGIANEFFPGYFAPCPYDESLAGFHFPLSSSEATQRGYRVSPHTPVSTSGLSDLGEIPDSSRDTDESLQGKAFLDGRSKKRFSFTKAELAYAKKQNVPLPREHYLSTIKDLFSQLYYNGSLRKDRCAVSGAEILTNLPPSLTGRIVSEAEYHKVLS